MKYWRTFGILLVLTIFIFFLCLPMGSIPLSFQGVWNTFRGLWEKGFVHTPGNTLEVILWDIRIPRLLMAFLGGAILSHVGILMQTVTKNPLAEPYVLGISAGASAGAVSAIILGFFSSFGSRNVYVGAFSGAALSTALVLGLQGRSRNPVRLVLMGMGINAFFTAVTTFLIYSSKNEAQVRSAMFWTTGSLSGVHYGDLFLPGGALALLLLFGGLFRKELDLLLLGRKGAEQMGLSLSRLQIGVILVSSLSIGALVAKVGVIGFVGLIVPHLARKIHGVKHRGLFLYGVFLGGMILMITDTLARTVFSPNELPIGVMTGLVGAPVFLQILRRTGDFS